MRAHEDGDLAHSTSYAYEVTSIFPHLMLLSVNMLLINETMNNGIFIYSKHFGKYFWFLRKVNKLSYCLLVKKSIVNYVSRVHSKNE